jgi:hypothetical protein
MDAARERILSKYGVSPEARLSGGMEAEVYAWGPDAVLKLYPGTVRPNEMRTLQAFYDSLERERVPYALPRIHTVAQEGDWLVTVEQRLAGTRMSALLPALTPGELETTMGRYLDAALAVSNLSPPPGFDRYKLLDPESISRRAEGDWHRFLARYLALQLEQVGRCLARDVPHFADRVRALQAVLDPPYRGAYRLVHGDFFPGNLMVDGEGQVTALLDFGLLTMYGDPLFDIATGWVFFDMYDKLGARARERCLDVILGRLGGGVRGTLYRYVLIYSILSANTYSPACADGHYRWCVDNLNTPQYWDALA